MNEERTSAKEAERDCDCWDVPVTVGLLAYMQFNRRMDSQLRRLVLRQKRKAVAGLRRPAENGPKGIAK